MTTDKFQIEDEAVRSEADRISKETRRMRREFNGTTQHLKLDPRIIEDLSKRGHLCWCNDDLRGHLHYLEGIGYKYVTNREAYGEREGMDPDARAMVRYGTADNDNHPQDIYLMIQPWEFYEEDQRAMQAETNKVDKIITQGENDVQRSTGRIVQYETNKN